MPTSGSSASHGSEPRRNHGLLSGVSCHLEVVLFSDPDNQVHNIRNAAGALAALFQLAIHHGGHDDLPGIGLQQRQDDPLDVPIGNHVALADEHFGPLEEVPINRP